MAADKTTIGLSTLGAIGISLLTLLGASLFTTPHYYCENRPNIGAVTCDSLSTYYNLSNGKCVNAKDGNKLCTSGWLKITNDTQVHNEEDMNLTCHIYDCKYGKACTCKS